MGVCPDCNKETYFKHCAEPDEDGGWMVAERCMDCGAYNDQEDIDAATDAYCAKWPEEAEEIYAFEEAA